MPVEFEPSLEYALESQWQAQLEKLGFRPYRAIPYVCVKRKKGYDVTASADGPKVVVFKLTQDKAMLGLCLIDTALACRFAERLLQWLDTPIAPTNNCLLALEKEIENEYYGPNPKHISRRRRD